MYSTRKTMSSYPLSSLSHAVPFDRNTTDDPRPPDAERVVVAPSAPASDSICPAAPCTVMLPVDPIPRDTVTCLPAFAAGAGSVTVTFVAPFWTIATSSVARSAPVAVTALKFLTIDDLFCRVSFIIILVILIRRNYARAVT